MPPTPVTSEKLYGSPQEAFQLLDSASRKVWYMEREYSLVVDPSRAVESLKHNAGYALRYLLDRSLLVGLSEDGAYAFLFFSREGGRTFRQSQAWHSLSQMSLIELQELSDKAVEQKVSERVTGFPCALDLPQSDFSIIGIDPQIKAVAERIRRVATTEATVMLLGETGVGKELFARAIHALSTRAEQPFVAVNCAAMQDTLLESELFGYEKGAFTDAKDRRAGKFELAHGGTLFLDEVADLSLAAQVKILRAIDRREINRLGGRTAIPVDIRVVCATNKNLAGEVQKKLFREDLYYRLVVFPIRIPTLRERGDDIRYLLDFFLEKHAKEMKRPVPRVPASVVNLLLNYHWPGNVRQLENAVCRALVISPPHEKELQFEDFDLTQEVGHSQGAQRGEGFSLEGLTPEMEAAFRENGLNGIVCAYELRIILAVLKITNGNKSEAARILGMNRVTLVGKMKRGGIPLR